MPIIKSAIKRAKQTIKRNLRNVGIKRDIKEATKAFIAKPSAVLLSAAHSEIDTAVKKKLLKKNTAARRKAQLSKIAKDAGVKLATGKKAAVKAPADKSAATKAAPATTAAPKVAAKPATAAAKKPAVKAASTVAKKAAVKKPAAKKTTK